MLLDGISAMVGYIYDADGNRVAKGPITAWSCDPTTNGFESSAYETDYVLNQSGQTVTETTKSDTGVMQWNFTNVYANGVLFATYDAQGLHFLLNDWLGTRRASTDYEGVLESLCASLPYGDGLNCTNSPQSPNEQHFTGKQHDQESGNDYFGARYYGSSMGRFVSPDPSQMYYANANNPQSFNLYNYGRDNPLVNTDPTGLDCIHINNDTGAYEGFESGDCDNSTKEKAESGYYVDGTVNSVSFNGQGQVVGYSSINGTEGDFDSFAGSTSPDAGPATGSFDPYSNAVSSVQSVTVNGNQPAGANTSSSLTSAFISPIGVQRPSGMAVMSAYNSPPPPDLTGDASCLFAPNAVSDIHNIERGINQNAPQASTDGSYGASIWQSTTRGSRPFGNAEADSAFNASFLGLESVS